MNKTTKIATVALTVFVGIGLLGTQNAYAQEAEARHPMIQSIMDRFNPGEKEVTEFMTEQRGMHHENHMTRMNERLNEAVTEGKLTEAQKAKLIARRDSHRAEIESMTYEERMSEREEHHAEFSEWAKSNGIDLEELDMGHRGSMKGHHGFRQL